MPVSVLVLLSSKIYAMACASKKQSLGSCRWMWRVQVRSNYGRPDYTCIYRVRVHGIAPGEPEAGLMEDAASASGSASSGSF